MSCYTRERIRGGDPILNDEHLESDREIERQKEICCYRGNTWLPRERVTVRVQKQVFLTDQVVA